MKISVITICYNNESDIRDTIKSVIEQEYPFIEYIIIDGNSTDKTMHIVNEYSSQITKIISEPDDGMYDAINKGFKLASGEVCGLIHAGDRLYDDKVISRIAKHFTANDIDAMYGHSILVNEEDKPVRVNKSPKFKKYLFKMGWMPSHQSIYIRKELFDRLGYYRLDLGGSADYEFVLRYFYINDIRIKRLDSFILRFSMGGRSTSNYQKRLILSQRRHLKAWKINGENPPLYLIPLKLGRKIKQFYLAAWYRLKKAY